MSTGDKQKFLDGNVLVVCVKKYGGGFWIYSGGKIEKTVTSRKGDKGGEVHAVEAGKKYLLFANTSYRCGL